MARWAIRRATYLKRAEVEERTANRDLRQLVDLDLLRPVGETKGRHYVAGPGLASVINLRIAAKKPLVDPYPWLPARLVQPGAPD